MVKSYESLMFVQLIELSNIFIFIIYSEIFEVLYKNNFACSTIFYDF